MAASRSQAILFGAAFLASSVVTAQEVANTIYQGGPILTMNDLQPTAEAVAVKNGDILAVGDLADVTEDRGSETLKATDKAGDPAIDVIAYPDVLEAKYYLEAHVSKEYTGKVRVGGCKLTIDGSPRGFTALRQLWRRSPLVADHDSAHQLLDTWYEGVRDR